MSHVIRLNTASTPLNHLHHQPCINLSFNPSLFFHITNLITHHSAKQSTLNNISIYQNKNMPLSLTDLPYTIFTTIITTHLTPSQTILCRRLSRAFLAALTRSDLCISLILTHFPRSLEGRRLRAYLKSNNLDALEGGDWAAVFARLARRYFHLGNALPWKVEKVKVLKDEDGEGVLRGVAPWNRHLSLNGKTAAFHFWDPVWTVAPVEGLLVYPAPLREEDYDASCVNGGGEGGGGVRYRARDLQTGKEVDVPFDLRGKIVRRVRVSHGVLVFEWCEQKEELLSHDETTGRVYRHYATVYSVRRRGAWDGVIPQRGGGDGSSSEMPWPAAYTWEFELRCEFAIHPVGFALDHQDRFFSTHNATHYAVYTWQPRSPASGSQEYGGGGPLESLTIWEFFNPPTSDTTTTPEPQSPRIIRTMSTLDLHHSAIRQGTAPALRAMALDDCTWDHSTSSPCGHLFITEEEHRWSAGLQSSSNPPRLHRVKTTGIPLVGEGPRWVDDCGGGGGVNLRFCWRGRWRRAMTEEAEDGVMLPHDDDGSGGGEEEDHVSSAERAWSRSQTWPGRAPCWRHDDFPYVTLSEVFDAAAGVRVIARDCFMLETLSVHIRPRIRVQGVGPDGEKVVSRRVSSGTATTTLASTPTTNHEPFSQQQTQIAAAAGKNTAGGGKTSTTTTEGPDGHEVQFADALWSEMMGKGFICGDERWLVGEDTKGDVTILVF